MRWGSVVVCAVVLSACAGDASGGEASFPVDAPDGAMAARVSLNGEGHAIVSGLDGWTVRDGLLPGSTERRLRIDHESEDVWMMIRMSGDELAGMTWRREAHAGDVDCRASLAYGQYDIDCPPMASGWVRVGTVAELR
jgi:hypothetical protein